MTRIVRCIICGGEMRGTSANEPTEYNFCAACGNAWVRYYLLQWKGRLLSWIRFWKW